MNRRNNSIVLSLCVFFAAFSAGAEVYWLRPFGKQTRQIGARIDELPGARVLLNEPLVVNGYTLDMAIGLIPRPMDEVLAEAAGKVRRGPDSARIDLPPVGNWRTCFLLLPGKNGESTVFMEMRVPEKLSAANVEWPSLLPLPPGAVPVEVLFFPARNAYYGAFSGAGSPAIALPQLAATLTAQGWTMLTGEAEQTNNLGRGEIFLLDRPRSLLWVTLDEDGGGVVYRRPLGGR